METGPPTSTIIIPAGIVGSVTIGSPSKDPTRLAEGLSAFTSTCAPWPDHCDGESAISVTTIPSSESLRAESFAILMSLLVENTLAGVIAVTAAISDGRFLLSSGGVAPSF